MAPRDRSCDNPLTGAVPLSRIEQSAKKPARRGSAELDIGRGGEVRRGVEFGHLQNSFAK